MTDERPLTGGNVSTVVRVGGTVRRPLVPQSPAVHRLLRLLEAADVPAPRLMGTDPKGREILGFIEGETTFPRDMWTSEAGGVAAQLLRRFHDATIALVGRSEDPWVYAYPDAARHEVICHNDFAPYNMVFRGGLPAAILDFDLCGPGPRIRDLAYLAYWMVPLSFGGGDMTAASEADLAAGSPRLLEICHAYGSIDPGGVPGMVQEVLDHMGSETAARGMVGDDVAARLKADGHLDHWQGEARAYAERHADIAHNLQLQSC